MSSDWNPELYLRFQNERTQPAIDLLSRIFLKSPKKILDVGCGPGNSTQVLAQKWPTADILGIDNSAAMIAKAKKEYPTSNWSVLDVQELDVSKEFDLIFSNAVLHWCPDHENLLNRLLGGLTPGGTLAIQVPLYHEMPIYTLVERLFHQMYPTASEFQSKKFFNFNSSPYYYELLSRDRCQFSIWETNYVHVMNSYQQILEMIKSTGLKPYLDEISDDQKENFEQTVLQNLPNIYSTQSNGKILFPFKRLFIIAVPI